jgi:trimethylamine--corrinoid protein Co-methyltransferase
VATAFTLAEHVAPIVEMLDIAAGGPGGSRRGPS